MEILPLVTQAEYRGEYKIRVRFNGEVESTQVIAWPNGAGIAPESLHERAKAGAAE